MSGELSMAWFTPDKPKQTSPCKPRPTSLDKPKQTLEKPEQLPKQPPKSPPKPPKPPVDATCYLFFEPANYGSLWTHWSVTPLNGALSKYTPDKRPPESKLVLPGARTEIKRGVTNSAGPKAFYQGLAYFVKLCCFADGDFTWLADHESLPATFYLLDANNKVTQLEQGQSCNFDGYKALAIIPKKVKDLRVATIDVRRFIELGEAAGATLPLDGSQDAQSPLKNNSASKGNFSRTPKEPLLEFEEMGLEVGIEIWRIEKMRAKMLPALAPKGAHLQLYEGDAYIILKTSQKNPNSKHLDYDIFFWIGNECSKDEQGVAAYKTVELDELLGGAAVQRRETQGRESDLFLQSFASVQYKAGGMASGFRHVQKVKVHKTRLLHCTGGTTGAAKFVRVHEALISARSLNSGDVFILTSPSSLTIWNGKESSQREKCKALEVALSIRDEERGGKAEMIILNEGQNETSQFWAALGGEQTPQPAAIAEPESMETAQAAPTLYKISDAEGQTKVATGELTHEMLCTSDVYILDVTSEIYVWVGKGASNGERVKGMSTGTQFSERAGRPPQARIIKVLEHAEPPLFKHNFSKWPVPELTPPTNFGSSANPEKKLSINLGEMLSSLFSPPKKAAESEMEVPLGGDLSIWSIEDFKPVEVAKHFHGEFHAGDSYIITYTYTRPKKRLQEVLIFFWLGAKSSADEKGAAALIAKDFDDAVGGAATQVRVMMGKEPSYFLRLFGGRMVVHAGGHASGFKNRNDVDTYDTDGVSLFHVKGRDADHTHTVQVAERACNLNSGDCFVLRTPRVLYVWNGTHANRDEEAIALRVAEQLRGQRSLEVVEEGGEDAEFWSVLGGKAEYARARAHVELEREPLLFVCSNRSGTFRIEPLLDFSQADLEEGEVYLLDSYASLYVWVGSGANEEEKRLSLEAAHLYPAKKGTPDVPVVVVHSGSEPPFFKALFVGWDSEKKKAFVDPYEAKLEAAGLEAAKVEESEEDEQAGRKSLVPHLALSYKPPETSRMRLDQLTSKPVLLTTFRRAVPNGIDPTRREAYLNDEDFEQALGMSRATFAKMPEWRRNILKKKAGLF